MVMWEGPCPGHAFKTESSRFVVDKDRSPLIAATVKRSFEKILFLTNWFPGRLIAPTTIYVWMFVCMYTYNPQGG